MRRTTKLPLFFVAATLAGIGCAVTFGPGDYTGGGLDAAVADVPLAPDAITDADALQDGAPVTSGRRLVVLAGEKDGSETSTNDVWGALIDANGDVGAFEYLQPGLFRGSLVTANVADGRLFVVSRANGRSVEHIVVDRGLLVPPWQGQRVDFPPFNAYGQIFSGSSLLALGGAGTVSDDDGGSMYVRDDRIHVTRFDGGAFGPLAVSDTKLPVGMRDMAAAAYKDFIYVVGGDGADDAQESKVYVGRVDSVAGVGELTETSRVINPQNNQPHTPFSPIVCAGAGRIFMAGGTSSGGLTDIVLSATIDETNGALSAWKAVTKLPGPLRGAGCAIWNDTLHLIGGVGVSSRSDRIIRARFAADGTLGEWELSSGAKLPAARSSVIAVTL